MHRNLEVRSRRCEMDFNKRNSTCYGRECSVDSLNTIKVSTNIIKRRNAKMIKNCLFISLYGLSCHFLRLLDISLSLPIHQVSRQQTRLAHVLEIGCFFLVMPRNVQTESITGIVLQILTFYARLFSIWIFWWVVGFTIRRVRRRKTCLPSTILEPKVLSKFDAHCTKIPRNV